MPRLRLFPAEIPPISRKPGAAAVLRDLTKIGRPFCLPLQNVKSHKIFVVLPAEKRYNLHIRASKLYELTIFRRPSAVSTAST